MDKHHGLVVGVEITHSSGTAEREAALKMLASQPRKIFRLTVGIDKGYDCKAFDHGCRKLGIAPMMTAPLFSTEMPDSATGEGRS